MKIIRASEIGTYQFCNRAWWYQLQGYEPENQFQLEQGKEFHNKHFYVVNSVGCLQAIAYGLLLVAIISSLIYLIQLYM